MNETLPNFFIIGAPKCGTTSLSVWLREHPSIYMSPIKEPFYFSRDISNQQVRDWQSYLTLFKPARAVHKALGEASTSYLFSRVAVQKIEDTIREARYIAMIRNPVDMAYALHDQHIRSFNEDVIEFREAWYLSQARKSGQQVPLSCRDPILLDYQSWCKLGEQVERLYSIVPRERVLILVLDDIKADPRHEYLRVQDFLGVEDDGRIEFSTYNQAHMWRSPIIGRAIRWISFSVSWAKHVARIIPKHSLGFINLLNRLATIERERLPLSPDFRAEIEGFFIEDVMQLEKMTGRDFSSWFIHQTDDR